jgi:hypothetical protein
MRIAVSGSHGMIGGAVVKRLGAEGAEVVRLARGEARGAGEIALPMKGEGDLSRLEGLDGVVHLAGEPIMGRWTAEKKERIRRSRVEGTATLSGALAGLAQKPAVMVCASAIGYYGHSGDRWVDEQSAAGEGFLAEVCRDWEAATGAAREAGIRVVNLRIGLVLSGEGGALKKMLPMFRLGLGGPIADGSTWWSWIALEDLVGVIVHALQAAELSGPVNAVGPYPVTNKEFTKALGRVLGRPTVLSVPAFVLRAVMGEMAEEMVLSGQRVRSKQLEASGFRFKYRQLEAALRAMV